MVKVRVQQVDGEISITHTGPTKVYEVSKSVVEVPEEELEMFLTHVDGAVAVTVPDSARKDEKAAAEAAAKAQADADAAAQADAEANQQAVADANAEGAARAAAELRSKAPKKADVSSK